MRTRRTLSRNLALYSAYLCFHRHHQLAPVGHLPTYVGQACFSVLSTRGEKLRSRSQREASSGLITLGGTLGYC